MTTGDFLQALADAGLEPVKHDLVADGVLHRYRVDGDKAGSLNGWYVLHLDDHPFGVFGSWKSGKSLTWTAGRQEPVGPAERAALKARMAEAKKARAAEQEKVYLEAAARAAWLWQRAKPASNSHPYLLRKQVGAFGIRELRGALVLPLRDSGGRIATLQFIGEDERKTFLSGGRKRGCYLAIGTPARTLCICEGYATGATIYQSTGHACAVAFDAGNLLPVAKALRGKFRSITLVVCADNDAQTEGNPGLTAATAAARAVGAALAVPKFAAEGCHG